MGLLIDEVVFPGFRQVKISQPVFITGVYRSGTTFLHRLIARDPQLSTMLLGEILLTPSIAARKVMAFFQRLLPLERTGEELLSTEYHQTALDAPEEDEYLLLHQFAGLAVGLPAGLPELARRSVNFDRLERDRTELFAFYRDCVKRHLFVANSGKTYLAKNPALCSRLETLFSTFPDARVVVLHRAPDDVLKSFHAMMTVTWKAVGVDAQSPELVDFLAEVIISFHDAISAFCANDLEKRVQVVLFDDLVNDPRAVVEQIYHRWSAEAPQEILSYLESSVRQQDRRKPTLHDDVLELLSDERHRELIAAGKRVELLGESLS